MNTLRNILIGAGSAVILAGMATAASAQSTDSDSATVSASIIQPIAITKNNDVNFGTVARPNTASTSTIELDPTASTSPVTVDGGTAIVQVQGSRGQFTITGDGGRSYALTGSTTAFNLTRSGGTETISFTPAFAVDSGTVGGLPGAAYSAATQLLYAGGEFDISNTTVPGAYSGTMTLTVTYN